MGCTNNVPKRIFVMQAWERPRHKSRMGFGGTPGSQLCTEFFFCWWFNSPISRQLRKRRGPSSNTDSPLARVRIASCFIEAVMMITAVYFQARPRWCFQTFCLYVPTGACVLCKILGRGLFQDKNSDSTARLVRCDLRAAALLTSSETGHVPLSDCWV